MIGTYRMPPPKPSGLKATATRSKHITATKDIASKPAPLPMLYGLVYCVKHLCMKFQQQPIHLAPLDFIMEGVIASYSLFALLVIVLMYSSVGHGGAFLDILLFIPNRMLQTTLFG